MSNIQSYDIVKVRYPNSKEFTEVLVLSYCKELELYTVLVWDTSLLATGGMWCTRSVRVCNVNASEAPNDQ